MSFCFQGQRPPQIVYLPSTESILKLASTLYFNDADWLEQTQTSLVDARISMDDAKALGCRSLRYHNQVC